MRAFTTILAFLFSLPSRFGILLANAWSRLRNSQIPDYILIDLGEKVVERATPLPLIWRRLAGGTEPQSLEELRKTLLTIARDPRPKGIVLRVDRTDMTMVQAQSLASLLFECKQASIRYRGRRTPLQVVCYLFQCNVPAYIVGAAADRLFLAPVTTWDLKGLLWSAQYMRRFLDRLGVEFDVVRAGRWKSATSPLTAEFMDELERSHRESVMDSYLQQIVDAVSTGRHLPREDVEAAMAGGPLLPAEALKMRLVDDICTWVELPLRLADTMKLSTVSIKPIDEIRGLLRRSYRRKYSKAIGLIEVKGMISFGSAGGPTIPGTGSRACNHADLIATVRKARQRHRQLAGILLYVDSPGGSALASHVMLDALQDLAVKLPVVVYMGGVAASGGYYVSMGGTHIIAQQATLTGSIGVFSAKPVVSQLLQRLGVLTTELAQSENAGVYSSNSRWTPSQRQVMQAQVDHIYNEFKRVVAEGRNMEAGRVEELAEGKVWTGQQALAHKLVDDTGPLAKAVQYIRDKAQIPHDLEVRVLDLGARKKLSSLYPALVPAGLARFLNWTALPQMDHPSEGNAAPEAWMLADDLY